MGKPGPCHVALLRGINVGGKNIVPMKTLAALFESAGAADVRTYIQSGNVVFSAGARAALKIARDMPGLIERELGVKCPVVLRSAAEMARAAADNPFLKAGVQTEALYVGFLAEVPDPKRARALDPKRSPGDTFAVVGREVYMHLGTGAAKTKLTNAWFDAGLGTVSTLRNWRTVLRLVEMTAQQTTGERQSTARS